MRTDERSRRDEATPRITRRPRTALSRLAPMVLLAAACVPDRLRQIPIDALRVAPQRRPETVYVTLTDGTRFVLHHPHFMSGDLAGQVHECEGPACELVRRNDRVGPAAVREISVWGPSRAREPPPARWPRVGIGVGTSLMFAYSPRFAAGGIGVEARVAARLRRGIAVELGGGAGTVLLSWIVRGALTAVVTPISWLSVVTGVSVQHGETQVRWLFGGGGSVQRGLVFGVPLEVRIHWLGEPNNGTGHGVEFTLGVDVGVETSRADTPDFAIGGHVGLGYGWR